MSSIRKRLRKYVSYRSYQSVGSDDRTRAGGRTGVRRRRLSPGGGGGGSSLDGVDGGQRLPSPGSRLSRAAQGGDGLIPGNGSVVSISQTEPFGYPRDLLTRKLPQPNNHPPTPVHHHHHHQHHPYLKCQRRPCQCPNAALDSSEICAAENSKSCDRKFTSHESINASSANVSTFVYDSKKLS